MPASPVQGQLSAQGFAVRDRGGVILPVDSDEIGIQNIAGQLVQVTPSGSATPIGLGGIKYDVTRPPYGAVPGTDCTAAIQQAINDSSNLGSFHGFVYLPFSPLPYYTTDNLEAPYGLRIVGDGPYQSVIVALNSGLNNKYLIHAPGTSPIYVENLGLQNAAVGGGGIYAYNAGGVIALECRNLNVNCVGNGIYSNVFQAVLDNIAGQGNWSGTGSPGEGFACIRINSGGACHMSAIRIAHYDTAIQISGLGISCDAVALEVNNTAWDIGVTPMGSGFSGRLSGLYWEANKTMMQIESYCTLNVSGGSGTGGVGAVGGKSTAGILVKAFCNATFENVGVSGGFERSAIEVRAAGTTWRNVVAANLVNGDPPYGTYAGGGPLPGASAWNIRCEPRDITLINCSGDANAKANNLGYDFKGLATTQDSSVNLIQTSVSSLNKVGINAAVGAGTTTLAVVFPTISQAGEPAVYGVALAAGGSLTVGQTYYYAASWVGQIGETDVRPDDGSGIGGAWVVTPTPGNQKAVVSLLVVGHGPTRRQRLYRGLTYNVFDGWFWADVPDGHNIPWNYTDDGTLPYDGYTSPMSIPNETTPPGNYTGTPEPDANYGVHVDFPFDMGRYWITAKSTLGFTINWATAPGGNTTLNWRIYR